MILKYKSRIEDAESERREHLHEKKSPAGFQDRRVHFLLLSEEKNFVNYTGST